MREENQFYKFLEKIMFKNKDGMGLIKCAMQFDFDLVEDDGHNVLDRTHKIRSTMHDVWSYPCTFDVSLLSTKRQSLDFFQNIDYAKYFRINKGWGAIAADFYSTVQEANLEKNIIGFFDNFKYVAERAAIKKVKRIVLVSTYEADLRNIDDRYMVPTPFENDITTEKFKTKVGGRKYDCRMQMIHKKQSYLTYLCHPAVPPTTDVSVITLGVSLKGSFELQELEAIVKEMSEKTQRDQALNLFGIVKDFRPLNLGNALDIRLRALDRRLRQMLYGAEPNFRFLWIMPQNVADDPTVGTVGGIDRSVSSVWRNT